MFSFRRSALRVLHRPQSAVRSVQSTRSFVTRGSIAASPSVSRCSVASAAEFNSLQNVARAVSVPVLARRSYATDDQRDPEVMAEAAAEAAEAASDEVVQEAAAEVAEEAAEEAVDNAREAAAEAAEAMDKAAVAAAQAEGAVDAASSAAAAAAPSTGRGRLPGTPEPNVVYAGNLFFDISESTLQNEFETIGPVTSVRIIKDARGLSKGFAYITFTNAEHAQQAVEKMNRSVVAGRHIIVQPSRGSRAPASMQAHVDAKPGFLNPPGKTLFIGNMSYEMTDKDLNDLFRQIKNVLDVRVAIDRRTGQPRGFAHADFTDNDSALEAAEFLRGMEFYGRRLRVDFTAPNAGGHRIQRAASGSPPEQ